MVDDEVEGAPKISSSSILGTTMAGEDTVVCDGSLTAAAAVAAGVAADSPCMVSESNMSIALPDDACTAGG